MQRNSPAYIVLFSGIVCAVCSLFVASSATFLKERQVRNALLDKQTKVLVLAGLIEKNSGKTAEEIQVVFDARIDTRIVKLETGAYDTEGVIADPAGYDQLKASKDPAWSVSGGDNIAGLKSIPNYAKVYLVNGDDGNLELLVLPVEGKGLWSTLYGFVALRADFDTIHGLTFYKHGETPGLGGEVDNPRWRAKWADRKVFDENFDPAIRVIKGPAGPPEEAPFEVDGLSGATITSNGVTYLMQFWLGEDGFGPYLEKLRSEGGAS
jgi:Na+-transporting NADH:ubiquinone oxidoreductase subunit C